MNIFQEVENEIRNEETINKIVIDEATKLMDAKLIEVLTFLKNLGLQASLDFNGWFKRIEINLKIGSNSNFTKSHVKVLPNGVLKYACGHHSVNKYAGNEVLTEIYDINNINELIPLIKTDIKNTK